MTRIVHIAIGVATMLVGAFILFVTHLLHSQGTEALSVFDYWETMIPRMASCSDTFGVGFLLLIGLGLIVYGILEGKKSPLWPPILVAMLVFLVPLLALIVWRASQF